MGEGEDEELRLQRDTYVYQCVDGCVRGWIRVSVSKDI